MSKIIKTKTFGDVEMVIISPPSNKIRQKYMWLKKILFINKGGSAAMDHVY